MEQMTKEWKEVNPLEVMTKEDFLTLFAHLSLLPDEQTRLETEYWGIYEKFIETELDPKTCWLATRNLFANKESQIGDR